VAVPGCDDAIDEVMAVSGFSVPRLAGRVLAVPGADVVLAEWTADGAADGEPRIQAPLHRHQEDEAWYVLTGALRIRIGPDVVDVPAGGAAVVPGGVAHTYWNPGAEPATYLLIMGPRTYALVEAINQDHHTPAELRELFHRHGAELLD
jgi:mannose-6-phosphate isomerase-like protein (cupin superfamily)